MATVVSADTSTVEVRVVDAAVSVNVSESVVEVSSAITGPQGPRGSQLLSGSADPPSVIGIIGDQYINTTTGFLFGPKTHLGWGSGVELGVGLTIDEVAQVHYQTIPATTWIITHTLEFTPNITVVDLAGKVIEGDYQYSGNTITANFSEEIAGAAYLS